MMDIAPPVIGALVAGAFGAGLVDAIVGGGGLILIPLLMIALPTVPEPSIIATNKVASVSGTTTAAISFLRRVKVDKSLLTWAVPLALACSAGGALMVSVVDSAILRPIIIVLLLAVGTYVALKPSFGESSAITQRKAISRRRWFLALMVIGLISAYDGFFGPGTGTFLIISLTALLSRSFLESVAMTKVINVSTNVGALCVLAATGNVMWLLGFVLAIANICGSVAGARLVISRGTGFIRIMLLIVVVAMAGKLTYDLFNG
ncbi:TSUP family transporter [Corynebacterium auriscanis]|uniref:TSUP family transporter n=1 Tax=Corynebacterium auriscanis TaxID=99807 RepID=UPI002AFFDC09|nr:TSUP family transporter [Corynebacterium auriscanis]